jgi:TM2 domain-containing membrane protein YozV/predicted RNA-binding Zn-ribbon protein involved in translation (DUF1610 family)
MPAVVHCPGCSREVQVPDHLHGEAVICPRCGQRFAAPAAPPPLPTARPVTTSPPLGDLKFCTTCGASIRRAAVVCPSCGVPQPAPTAFQPRLDVRRRTSRIAAALLAFFFGGFGIHKFVLGYGLEGLIMLVVSVFGLPCFCIFPPIGLVSPVIMWIIGFIEGCIYLSKTDEEFHKTYEVGRKGWF